MRLASDLACPCCYDQYLAVLFSNSVQVEHHCTRGSLVAFDAIFFRLHRGSLLDLTCLAIIYRIAIVVATDSTAARRLDDWFWRRSHCVLVLACSDLAVATYASFTSDAAAAWERASTFWKRDGCIICALILDDALPLVTACATRAVVSVAAIKHSPGNLRLDEKDKRWNAWMSRCTSIPF